MFVVTVVLPTLVAAWERIRRRKGPVAPNPKRSLAANFLSDGGFRDSVCQYRRSWQGEYLKAESRKLKAESRKRTRRWDI